MTGAAVTIAKNGPDLVVTVCNPRFGIRLSHGEAPRPLFEGCPGFALSRADLMAPIQHLETRDHHADIKN